MSFYDVLFILVGFGALALFAIGFSPAVAEGVGRFLIAWGVSMEWLQRRIVRETAVLWVGFRRRLRARQAALLTE